MRVAVRVPPVPPKSVFNRRGPQRKGGGLPASYHARVASTTATPSRVADFRFPGIKFPSIRCPGRRRRAETEYWGNKKVITKKETRHIHTHTHAARKKAHSVRHTHTHRHLFGRLLGLTTHRSLTASAGLRCRRGAVALPVGGRFVSVCVGLSLRFPPYLNILDRSFFFVAAAAAADI